MLEALHVKAQNSERKRMNFDLRTTPDDTSQRMLNALEVDTKVPIHRHLKSSETVICLEGCFDEVFYEERSSIAGDESLSEGEVAKDESRFQEVARFRICPREKSYGLQIPLGAWHTVEVYEPSVILEAKDGAYGA